MRSRKVWIAAFAMGIFILCVGHFTAPYISFHAPLFQPLNTFTHTGASVFVRLASIPLRIVLVAFIISYITSQNKALNFENYKNSLFISVWNIVALFYSIDIYLSSQGKYSNFNTGLLVITALVWAAANYIPKALAAASLFIFSILAYFILIEQSIEGENNAFTIFGLQGVAFIVCAFRSSVWQRLWRFVAIAPALGYVFPLLEKLMLNPAGWLSGQTLGRYAMLWGIDLVPATALVLSLAFIAFQALFFLVVWRPRLGLIYYPIAILFHIATGQVLGFCGSLSPWITSLLLSMAVLLTAEESRTPTESFELR
jgi:hypothetical protein